MSPPNSSGLAGQLPVYNSYFHSSATDQHRIPHPLCSEVLSVPPAKHPDPLGSHPIAISGREQAMSRSGREAEASVVSFSPGQSKTPGSHSMRMRRLGLIPHMDESPPRIESYTAARMLDEPPPRAVEEFRTEVDWGAPAQTDVPRHSMRRAIGGFFRARRRRDRGRGRGTPSGSPPAAASVTAGAMVPIERRVVVPSPPERSRKRGDVIDSEHDGTIAMPQPTRSATTRFSLDDSESDEDIAMPKPTRPAVSRFSLDDSEDDEDIAMPKPTRPAASRFSLDDSEGDDDEDIATPQPTRTARTRFSLDE